jgi:hypothetical protein
VTLKVYNNVYSLASVYLEATGCIPQRSELPARDG